MDNNIIHFEKKSHIIHFEKNLNNIIIEILHDVSVFTKKVLPIVLNHMISI